jgi:hypothetical protein
MEMPQNCDKCRFQSEFKLYCDAMPYNFCGNTDDIERPDWCPLIELPPHGRLGDLDKLYEEISNGNKAYNGIEGYDGEYQHIGNVDDCMDVIKMADTVIEAEGETDGR